MKKRALAFILSLLMVAALMPVYAMATEEDIPEENKLFAILMNGEPNPITELSAAYNDWFSGKFYFGTDENYTELSRESLVFSSGLSVIGGPNPAECNIQFTQPGNHTVSYTDSTSGTSYTFPIYVALPDYGFYSSGERSESTFLNTLSAPMGEEATFYLNWGDTCSAPDAVIYGETTVST